VRPSLRFVVERIEAGILHMYTYICSMKFYVHSFHKMSTRQFHTWVQTFIPRLEPRGFFLTSVGTNFAPRRQFLPRREQSQSQP
jgi:hypothetical protein